MTGGPAHWAGGVFNRHPAGLASTLGLESSGVLPKQLAGQVIPTLEVAPFFLIGDVEAVGDITATTITAVGWTTFSYLVVPSGQLWYVHHYNVQTALLGGTARVAATLVDPRGYQINLGDPASGIAGEYATSYAHAPFFAPAGSALGMVTESFGGVNFDSWGYGLITRLRV